jgi:nucleoside-diphosphate-sugar epimerase
VNAVVRSHSSAARIARLSHDIKLADALDEDQLAEAFAGCDYAFHAIVGDERTITEAPAVAARAARRSGVKRIVYLSSGMVYGFSPPPGTDDETPPRTDQPRGYNRSKALAERSIVGLRESLGVDIVVLRPTIVYGPRSAQFTVGVARDILAGRSYLVDDGAGICNAVYVGNLVSAMWSAAVTPEAANQSFIVSDRERLTWRELYLAVAEGVGMDAASIAGIPAEAAIASLNHRPPLARLDAAFKTRLAGRVRSVIPDRAAARLKAAARALASAADSAGEPAHGLSLDAETVRLQLCRTQLPIAKAERILGYDPISADEGFRRTNSWLRSAGFCLR